MAGSCLSRHPISSEMKCSCALHWAWLPLGALALSHPVWSLSHTRLPDPSAMSFPRQAWIWFVSESPTL